MLGGPVHMHVWGGGGVYSAVLVGVWSAVGTCAYICMGGMYGAVVVDVWSAGGTCTYVCMGRGECTMLL